MKVECNLYSLLLLHFLFLLYWINKYVCHDASGSMCSNIILYYRKQEVEEELKTLDNRQKDDVQYLTCFQYSYGFRFSLILNKLKVY